MVMIVGDARRRELFKAKIADATVRWREGNKVMDLKIFFAGNATLIGEYEDIVSVHKLKKPRAIAVGTDPQGRGIMALQMLIGEPEEIKIINPSLMYDVKDEKLVNLYIQATTGIIPAKDLSNVIPIKGGDGGGKGGKLPPHPLMGGMG